MADLSVTATSVIADPSATTVTGLLGATTTAGQVVYLDITTNTWKLGDNDSATAAAKLPPGAVSGIALNGGASGQPVTVARSGLVTTGAVMTAGVAYYLSANAGGICPVGDITAGHASVIVGIATTTAVMMVSFLSSGVTL